MNTLRAGAIIYFVLIYLIDRIILKFIPGAMTFVIIYSIGFSFFGIVLIAKALDWLTDKIKYSGKKNDNEYIKKEEAKPIKEEVKPNHSAYKTPAEDPKLDLYFGEMGPRGYRREKRVAQNNETYEVLVSSTVKTEKTAKESVAKPEKKPVKPNESVIYDDALQIKDQEYYSRHDIINFTVPDGIKRIGKFAFQYCDNLKSVTIPESVEEIALCAFASCFRLTEVHINNLEKWCGIRFADNIANPLNYAHNLYLNGELVTELVFPKGRSKVNAYAFSECRCLETLLLPEGVKSIEEGAFRLCFGLTRVELPESLEKIGKTTFQNCKNLKSITIPENVEEIGLGAFWECDQLRGVRINNLERWLSISFEDIFANPLYSAHNLYFNGKLVTELTFPKGISKVNAYAFCGCSCLKTLVLPEGVKHIEKGAFNNCTGLSRIVLPESLESIGESVFSGCASLTEIYIPENVKSIGKFAFADCKNLVKVRMPEAVTEIKEATFARCENLTEVILSPETRDIEGYAFTNCISLVLEEIPDSVVRIGEEAFYACKKLSPEILEKIKKLKYIKPKKNPDLVYIPSGYLNPTDDPYYVRDDYFLHDPDYQDYLQGNIRPERYRIEYKVAENGETYTTLRK